VLGDGSENGDPMKLSRLSVPDCCGGTTVAWKLGAPIRKEALPAIVAAGYIVSQHFLQANILYVENQGINIRGVFGGDILQAICKTTINCIKYINDFEELLASLP
jgi:hypothetical protein